MSYSYLSEDFGITKFTDLPESMRKKHYKFYEDYHPESHLQGDSHIVVLLDNPDLRVFVTTTEEEASSTTKHNIFGRRQGDVGFPPFFFTFSNELKLNSFIQTLFIKNDLIKNKCVDSYIYNFNNLKKKCNDELCYEFFEELMDDKYLISSQKNHTISPLFF